jgi:hypothetical protein
MSRTVDSDYVFAVDEARDLLTIQAKGFWDSALLERFAVELTGRLRTMKDTGRLAGVLADATDFPVQSIPISLSFMDIVKRLDDDLLVPTAVLTKSMLLKLQALRIFVAPHIRIFGDHAAALAWLEEQSMDKS